MSEKTIWSTLKGVDVHEKKMVEQKNDLSYISWAKAWSALCDAYPNATMEKHCNEHGLPYFKDDQGWCFTKVTVKVNDKSITEVLPVLSFNNKPIQHPNSFQVNTSLQRCLAKAIALHGMGVTIYSGEDLTEESTIVQSQTDEPPGTSSNDNVIETSITTPDGKNHVYSTSDSSGGDWNDDTHYSQSDMDGKTYEDGLANIYGTLLEDHCKTTDDFTKFLKQNKRITDSLKANHREIFVKLKTRIENHQKSIKEKTNE